REEIGTAFGRDHLLPLFALTFVICVLLNQPYMRLANRLPLPRLLPPILHAFAISFVLLGAGFELLPPVRQGVFAWSRPACILGAGFFSWVTAFVACGVAVVWVHAVSHFTTGQGKRLFGLVSVGGTLGAIAGSDLSRQLASLPRQVLIVLAALVLE